jgi:hypothetical protein
MEFVTRLGAEQAEKRVRKVVKEIGQDECTFSRTVKCLPSSTNTAAASRNVKPPEMEFKSDGFWKGLDPLEVGQDKEGKPILGRTWVMRKEMWSARSPSEFLVEKTAPIITGPDPGTVYVVRSTSHQQDLYKVGLTRRAAPTRAGELSTATGVPLPFAVLATWEVGDCNAVEREIHRRLAVHRIADNREFFAAPLELIIKVAFEVVQEANAPKPVE